MSPRRRRRSSRYRTVAVVAAFSFVVASAVVPAGSFTTSTLDRDTTIDVAADDSALMGLVVNSTVRIGNTDGLISVTNNVNGDMKVTITLDSASIDDGDIIIDGVNHGDSASFTLSPDVNETVELDLVADCSLAGQSLLYDLDGNTSTFDGMADRSARMKAPTANRTSVVYHNTNDHTLRMINRSGSVTAFGFTTNGFGAVSGDYDCDGRTEVPFIDGNGGIAIIDRTGQRQDLVPDGVRNGSRLGVSDFDGDNKAEILYSNVSDNGTVYRVEHSESPVKVANVTVHSLTRRADINGDGDPDFAFTDPSNNVKYYDNATVYDTTVDTGGLSWLGDPADFDGDGTVRIPYIDHRNKLLLVDTNGNTQSVLGGSDGTFGSVGSFDYDNDGVIDFVYVDDQNNRLKYRELSTQTSYVTDSNGNRITADSNGTA